MADKKLSITADLKVKTTEAERTLQKLQKEGVKISNILKGLDINTSGGRAGFAKSLMTANKEMVKLRGTTHDTAKVMEHVYGRQLEKQSKNLDKYTKQIDNLNRKFKNQQYNANFQGAIGNDAGQAKYSSAANRTADRIVIAEAARQAIQATLTELKQQPAAPTTNWDTVRGSISMAQAIMGGGSQALGTYQSGKTMSAVNVAHTRNFERQMLGRMVGGDFSDLYFAGQRNGNFYQSARDQAGGQGAAKGQLALGAAGAAADAIQGGLTLKGGGGAGGMGGSGSVLTRGDYAQAGSGVGGGLNGIYSNMQNSVKGGPAAIEAATVQQEIEALKAQDPMTMAALNFIQSTAPMRVGASKSLQGKHMQAWGTGMGFGLDMGESFSAANQLNRQFGMGGMFGSSSTTRHTRLGGYSNKTPYSSQSEYDDSVAGWAAGKDVDNMADARRKYSAAHAMQFGGFVDPKTGQMQTEYSTTKRSGGLLSSVLGLERQGLDRGVAGTALGTMMQAGGGGAGGMATANRAVEEVMTKAFARGIRDARLAEEIVKATGEMAYGYGGAIKDMGAVGMVLSGGLDGNSTLRQQQANISGFQAANQLLSTNDYFRATSAETAKNVLGKNGSGLQMMAASKASLSDLIGGSGMLDAAGISPEQRQKMLSGRVNSMVGAFMNTNGNNNPQIAGLMEGMKGHDNDIVKTIQGGGGKLNDQLALLLSSTTGMSFEQAQGFARDLQGFGSKGDKSKGNFANHGDATAEATVRSQQEVLNELYKKEITIREGYLAALSNNSAAKTAAAIGDNTKNNPNYEAFNKFLDSFTSIMKDTFSKWNAAQAAQAAAPKAGTK